MTKLGLLRLLQGFTARLEISAGIGHVAVEPQLVKGVGKIVVIGDRLGVGLLVVGGADWLTVVVLVQQGLAPFITHADHVTDGTFELQFALDKCSAERIQAWMSELGDHLWVLDHNCDAGRRPQIKFMAIPESQAKR